MGTAINVVQLFEAAGLPSNGPVPWENRIPETRPGVYVVVAQERPDEIDDAADVNYLQVEVRGRWNPGQSIVYIGRTRVALSRRVAQFYRHKYGKKGPHRGGQDVKLLKCRLWVYWCPTEQSAKTENTMIEYFKARTNNRLPFANRVKSARIRTLVVKTEFRGSETHNAYYR